MALPHWIVSIVLTDVPPLRNCSVTHSYYFELSLLLLLLL